MKVKKTLILSIIVLVLMTVVNLFVLASTTYSIKVKGTGNAFHTTHSDGTEEWGRNRQNENDCSMTIIKTVK